LEEAKRELGLKTYSATVNAVLKEAVRRQRVRHLADFVGKVEWIGDLSAMRTTTQESDVARRDGKRRSSDLSERSRISRT
jgi:hypothetical protein